MCTVHISSCVCRSLLFFVYTFYFCPSMFQHTNITNRGGNNGKVEHKDEDDSDDANSILALDTGE